MKYTLFSPKSPEAPRPTAPQLNIAGSEDRYGAHSVQVFPTQGPLWQTHADARGFLDWYGTWNRGNFWFRDAGVQVWAYEETYDNWQDTYGMDSVVTFYHSGHGGMNNAGVFFAPLGANWDNRIDALSSNMIIGNEQLRYLFWSTCQSLKVPEVADVNPTRVSPVTTWHNANRGLRMIFGYQSNSVDNANYGKFFGTNWNAGQSFSTAWLNASWAISRNQIPTACAMGATAQEAQNRLFNERLFEWGSVSRNFYWWRWGGFERPVFQTAFERPEVPTQPEILLFGPQLFDVGRLMQLGSELGFTTKQSETVALGKDGTQVILAKNRQLTVDAEGRLTAVLGVSNFKNKTAIERDRAIEIANQTVSSLGFSGNGVELVFDSLRVDRTQGMGTQGSGTLEEAYVTDTTVVFRQTANGLRSINNNHGLVMVTVDNDGKVTRLHNSTRPVEGTATKPMNLAPTPNGQGKASEVRPDIPDELRLNGLFTEALSAEVGTAFGSSRSNAPIGGELVEALIGYDFSGDHGGVVAHREYQVDHGEGLQKIHRVRVPIFA